ncbi:hypothetical protein BCR34DRAFT_582987 [Clohesyomyces aquaticus]|uniref:Uncharacterized protein n=1 Tax=Clohesyomyces aquaticus TaxID=1231657 RepID=A0A1Y2A7R3_9PLEO|nr:hypothetical protein BCR34DRAFT_582987 [Clohesyomyces aquaticus]
MLTANTRSVAETGHDPDSAILYQLGLAMVVSHSNPNAIVLNLISAALAVTGANQAEDLAYELKVGNLVGACPRAQIQGQLVGSIFCALVLCGACRLYSSQHTIPGPEFLILSTARL